LGHVEARDAGVAGLMAAFAPAAGASTDNVHLCHYTG
jgi:hypothetical protein